MSRRFTVIVAALVVGILGSASATAAAGPPFELSVKRDRFVGASKGTLVFERDLIEYRTTNTDDARRWAYDQVKQFQILSPARIAILTYEDQGPLKFGADRTFQFAVVEGAVSAELVRFLLDHANQPVVTAVMPLFRGQRLFSALVKRQRQGRGSEGSLVMDGEELVYVTERKRKAVTGASATSTACCDSTGRACW